jgi:zinc ribbon protein
MPYCHNCGADLPPNAAFCAKCGAPAAAATATTPSAPPMYRYGSGYEKREKQEKQTRQSEKYEKREKGGDRSGPLIGGGVLILLGLIYYATITTPALIPSTEFWAYFFLGLGILLIIQAVYRFHAMHHHAAGMGSLWGGVILAAIGVAGIAGSGNFWPVILIAIGALVIVAGVTSRARAPRPP